MMAVEPLADRFAGRRAKYMDGSSELPFSSVSNCGVFSRITATEQFRYRVKTNIRKPAKIPCR